ncbi:MAG: metal-dependent hydrolase [Burkholderiaceae bacterium]|nr:metal-dependent hydrolase [Burkholderiaceae bacterium]
MACAAEHATFNFFAVTAVTTIVQKKKGHPADASAPAMGAAAACLPSLPDWLEPAVHPNHRSFFHSVTFATLVAYAMYRAYKWETQEPWERVARIVLLTGGAAYLAHLARDAFTPKSLPLI